MAKNEIRIFLETGLVEEYCLGLLDKKATATVIEMIHLYPEIESFAAATQQSLQRYAGSWNKKPGPGLKARILDQIELLEKENEDFEMGAVPLIHPHADRVQWLKLVKQHLPDRLPEPNYSKILRIDENSMVIAIWSTDGMAEEEHHQAQESFLILEGECECQVGNETIRLNAGDYYKMPMHVNHTVKVISPLIGVLQRVKVA